MALTIQHLTNVNFGAFALHLVVGCALTAWYFGTGKLTPNAIPTTLYEVVACGTEGKQACPKEVMKSNDHLLIILMLVFVSVTALAHLAYATCRSWYVGLITHKNNWMRWVEYAISATILLVVISISSGLKEFNAILLFITGCAAVMFLGDGVEKILANPTATGTHAHWSSTVAGWLVLIGIIVVLCRAFGAAKSNAEGNMPAFVPYVVVLTIVFYMSFGVVQLVHASGGFASYVQVELAYIILSFVSKTMLVLIVTSGLVARSKTPNVKQTPPHE
jgi:hypothetical protein